MDELIGEIVFRVLLEIFWKFIFWPIVLLLCTPFILINSVVVTVAQKRRFGPAVRDGYATASDFYVCWVF